MATDALIRDVILPNAGDQSRDHLAANDPSAPALDRLFLLFPGTGAAPVQYELNTSLAPQLGCHSIALAYESHPSINGITSIRQSRRTHRRRWPRGPRSAAGQR